MSVTQVPQENSSPSTFHVPQSPGECVVERSAFVEALSALTVVLDQKVVDLAKIHARLVVMPGQCQLHVFGTDALAVLNVNHCVPVGKMEREGVIMLPLHKIKDLLSDLTAPEVSLTAEDGKVVLQWIGGRCTIASVEDTLPVPRSFEDEWDFYQVDSSELYNGVTCALWGVDPADHRPQLQGVQVRFRDGRLEFCGTDATQLSLYSAEVMEVTNRPAQSAIIPFRGAQVISKVLDWAYPKNAHSGPVLMTLGAETAMFNINGAVGGGIVQVRLQEGRFPKYEKILENLTPNFQRTKIAATEMVSCLRQAGVCLDGENVAVEMYLAPEESVFSALTPGVGLARIGVKFIEPPVAAMRVRLDLRVLLRAIQHLPKSAELDFAFLDGQSMVQFSFGQWVYVLMPLVDPKK